MTSSTTKKPRPVSKLANLPPITIAARSTSHQVPGTHHKRPSDGAQPGKRSSTRRRDNIHRNVHIAQKDQAIWEYFRARTAKGTEIYIGKNTIIGPGVQIIAEKGSIKIGENNIISEGTTIINKSTEDLLIGNGNVFDCASRIEAARINDYNIFGAKCHIMPGALVGTGCVICPRVMIIAKKRIRDCTVIFGDNMVHDQPLMKKRNRAYIDQMVKVLRLKFKEYKKCPAAAPGGHISRHKSTRNVTKRESSGISAVKMKQQQNFPAKSRKEQPAITKPHPKV